MTVPAEVLATDPLVHEFLVRPHLHGEPFDPYTHGGDATALILRTPVNSAIVYTSGPAARVAYGLYRFDVPPTVPHGVYLAQVIIRHTTTSTPVTGDFGTIAVPGRMPGPVAPWTTYRDVIRRDDDLHRQDPETVLESIDAASHVLYMLSGRKYRGRAVTSEVYRCEHSGCRTPATVGYSHNRRYGSPTAGLMLRSTPVRRILQVSLENSGRIIPAHEYEVEDNKYLVPKYGATWSPCSGLRVTYEFGANPPQVARSAAEVLAAELAKGAFGMESCRLPDRITSISRQGVSYTVLDPQNFLSEGRVGLYEVDLFLAAANPDKARARARVFTPGKAVGRRTSATMRRDIGITQDLVFVAGQETLVSYTWVTNGLPHLITGRYTVRAFASSTDLAPYIAVEPGGVQGLIEVRIPAAAAPDILTAATSWYLEAVSTAGGDTRRLITGAVRSA